MKESITEYRIPDLDIPVPYVIAKWWEEVSSYQKSRYMKYRQHSRVIQNISAHYMIEYVNIHNKLNQYRLRMNDSDAEWEKLWSHREKIVGDWKSCLKLILS